MTFFFYLAIYRAWLYFVIVYIYIYETYIFMKLRICDQIIWILNYLIEKYFESELDRMVGHIVYFDLYLWIYIYDIYIYKFYKYCINRSKQ